jgi:hypothetical protein
MNITHPKTNIRRTFAKLCFDFMVDTLAIELRFSQQVAPEAVKNISTPAIRCKNRAGSINRRSRLP